MKDVNLVFLTFAVLSALAPSAFASHEHRVHKCGIKYRKYYLDDEPSEYGVYAGKYAKGKIAYVGLAKAPMGYTPGRLQQSPPGMLIMDFLNAGSPQFVNGSDEILFIAERSHQEFVWVESQYGETVPYAVDYASAWSGLPMYFGRIKKNGYYKHGPVSLTAGCMFYLINDQTYARAKTRYQVLTCKTCREDETETATVLPPGELSGPSVDTGCINNWVEYKGEEKINGIAAGVYDCGNTAYVGKAQPGKLSFPGRIQTVSDTGIYMVDKGKSVYIQNGSFYLQDNPNYSYSWVNYEGRTPSNAVFVRSDIPYAFAVGRDKIDGHMHVASVSDPVALVPDPDDGDMMLRNFEVLVCDPWPKYRCVQEWKKYNLDSAPSADGFSIGVYKDDIVSYIGRAATKCVNGCDIEVGRIQTAPSTAAGLYFLDELPAEGKFNNLTAEYLVKNPNYTYRFVPSRNGEKVKSALEVDAVGRRPFYIGVTKIDEHMFVGKVKSGEGLYFVDLEGNMKTTSTYDVVTCTQPNCSFGVCNGRSDDDWYGCPERKTWSTTLVRCVCKSEYKNVFAPSYAQWDEYTCSYSA